MIRLNGRETCGLRSVGDGDMKSMELYVNLLMGPSLLSKPPNKNYEELYPNTALDFERSAVGLERGSGIKAVERVDTLSVNEPTAMSKMKALLECRWSGVETADAPYHQAVFTEALAKFLTGYLSDASPEGLSNISPQALVKSSMEALTNFLPKLSAKVLANALRKDRKDYAKLFRENKFEFKSVKQTGSPCQEHHLYWEFMKRFLKQCNKKRTGGKGLWSRLAIWRSSKGRAVEKESGEAWQQSIPAQVMESLLPEKCEILPNEQPCQTFPEFRRCMISMAQLMHRDLQRCNASWEQTIYSLVGKWPGNLLEHLLKAFLAVSKSHGNEGNIADYNAKRQGFWDGLGSELGEAATMTKILTSTALSRYIENTIGKEETWTEDIENLRETFLELATNDPVKFSPNGEFTRDDYTLLRDAFNKSLSQRFLWNHSLGDDGGNPASSSPATRYFMDDLLLVLYFTFRNSPLKARA